MRYWWVNHKQTKKEEIAGGYLWAPIREASGARSQFYDNMRVAEPGDHVLSYAGGLVSHLGVVIDFAAPSPKPEDFVTAGANWSREGWMLPVEWRQLSTPIRPKDLIGVLGPLLPSKYSPIHPVTGNGNQKAYLAEVGKPVFDFLIGPLINPLDGSNEESRASGNPLEALDDRLQGSLETSTSLDATTRKQLVLARHGQGLFRSRVAQLEGKCRLTGIDNPRLLTASHIKPWRLCTTASERLDGANGLLLTPHVDRLFDRGYISFGASGDVLVSPRLKLVDLERLGLSLACATGCGAFSDQQAGYLSYHRETVFML